MHEFYPGDTVIIKPGSFYKSVFGNTEGWMHNFQIGFLISTVAHIIPENDFEPLDSLVIVWTSSDDLLGDLYYFDNSSLLGNADQLRKINYRIYE